MCKNLIFFIHVTYVLFEIYNYKIIDTVWYYVCLMYYNKKKRMLCWYNLF